MTWTHGISLDIIRFAMQNIYQEANFIYYLLFALLICIFNFITRGFANYCKIYALIVNNQRQKLKLLCELLKNELKSRTADK